MPKPRVHNLALSLDGYAAGTRTPCAGPGWMWSAGGAGDDGA